MRTGALMFEQRVSSRRERGTHGPGLESGRRSLFSRHPFNLRSPIPRSLIHFACNSCTLHNNPLLDVSVGAGCLP